MRARCRIGPLSSWLSLLLPIAFFVAFYWTGLDAWFYQDDFGWLNLRHDLAGWSDLPGILFRPLAHGNIRPWSERAPFLLFPLLFGMDPLPFRILAFLTQAANLVLMWMIVFRLTNSLAAAALAPLLWTLNPGLAPALYWSSIYNQILSTFFLLLPFWFLLRAIDTGQRRWWIWQWAAFIAGFGALETNVVYPALAALYALACARGICGAWRRCFWPPRFMPPSTLWLRPSTNRESTLCISMPAW